MKTFICALLVCLGSFSGGCYSPLYMEAQNQDLKTYLKEHRSQPEKVDLAGALFVAGDFGALSSDTLKTNAVPFKPAAVALFLENPDLTPSEAELGKLYARYGFPYNPKILNWKEGTDAPKIRAPFGLIRGTLKKSFIGFELEVSNINCATCHLGITYGPKGEPTGDVWMGAPSTSFNPEAYIAGLYSGFKKGLALGDDAFIEKMRGAFPEMSDRERKTIQHRVLPLLRKTMADLERTSQRFTPFLNGGVGLTNGVASIKMQLGLLDHHKFYPDEVGFTSIPDMGYRNFRSSLLYDGVYTVHGMDRFHSMNAIEANSEHLSELMRVVSYFTTPTQGMPPDRARKDISVFKKVVPFFARYRPPVFPGEVNADKVSRGESVFKIQCMSCHGQYKDFEAGDRQLPLISFPNRHSMESEMGTDPSRFNVFTPDLERLLARPKFSDNLDAAQTGGYVAQILAGLWATAPYLHNGSVPTLWHLLHPAQRPVAFEMGGHRLDYLKMGIKGEVGTDSIYRDEPWQSQPPEKVRVGIAEIYDTRLPGRSNQGHEKEFEMLSEDQRSDLIEYLKLL